MQGIIHDCFFMFWLFFNIFYCEIWDKRLHLSLVKGIFLFKLDQPAISEQCKWVLPIHSSVICHKSQGLHEDFEMLIRLSMVTSLCTFKNAADLKFHVRLKVVKVAPPPSIVKDVKAKCEIPTCPDCIASQGIFFKVYKIRRFNIRVVCHECTGLNLSQLKISKQMK